MGFFGEKNKVIVCCSWKASSLKRDSSPNCVAASFSLSLTGGIWSLNTFAPSYCVCSPPGSVDMSFVFVAWDILLLVGYCFVTFDCSKLVGLKCLTDDILL